MSAVVVKFPKASIARRKWKQQAIDTSVRQLRAIHPGQAARFYWDLARIWFEMDYSTEEVRQRDGCPALLAHSWAMIRAAKGGADTYEVIRFPASRTVRDAQSVVVRKG